MIATAERTYSPAVYAWYRRYRAVLLRLHDGLVARIQGGEVVVCRFCGQDVRLVADGEEWVETCGCPELRV